jgi:hypothetical protein
MQTWEYKVVAMPALVSGSTFGEDAAREFNLQAEDGWELFSALDRPAEKEAYLLLQTPAAPNLNQTEVGTQGR